MIKFQNVTKKYGTETVVLDNVSFELAPGGFVYLVGPTGAGKTTIFRLVIRDLEPTEGEIFFGDMPLKKISHSKTPVLRRKIGTVFQDLKLLMDRTVIENIMLPLLFAGVNEKEANVRAEELLQQVGLEGKADKFPLQLSGGERQRVAIARALIFEPELILADEPTGNLDLQTSLQIVELLQNINQKGTTVFMATHNETIIEKTDKRILMLEKGKLIKDRPSREKITHPPQKQSEEQKKQDAQKAADNKEEK